MKKTTLINSQLSKVIAMMGHKDTLTVADSGLPIPKGVERVDLALTRGIPSLLDTLEIILSELNVEEAIVASEMKEKSPEMYEGVLKLLDGVPIIEVTHDQLKEMTKQSIAVVRTGEYTPFSNIILRSGVVF